MLKIVSCDDGKPKWIVAMIISVISVFFSEKSNKKLFYYFHTQLLPPVEGMMIPEAVWRVGCFFGASRLCFEGAQLSN